MFGIISQFTLHREVPPVQRVPGPPNLLLESERAEQTLTNKHVLIILRWNVQKKEEDQRFTNLISIFVIQFPVKLYSIHTKSKGNMELI